MDDDRFKSLKNERIIKNKRGRQWVDLPKKLKEDSDDSEVSDVESVENINSVSEEDSDAISDDSNDLDFINLTKDANTTEQSTKRLAVFHFDYEDYSLAYLVDIIKSGMPKNGKIKNITKYPTELYMERIEEDTKFGPKEFRIKEYDGEQNDCDSDDSNDSTELNKANKNYAMSRLKFFITVLEFDSIETADEVYKMDGNNLGDSGLKLDLRYVPDDRKYDIPDKFMHLVQTQRPSGAKSKITGFKPSCFTQSKYKKTWDETPIDKVDFYEKAFEQSDCDLSDVENFCGGATESEYSATESESEFYSTVDGPIIPKLRRKRIPANDLRSMLNLDAMKSDSSDEEYEDDDEDDKQEEEEIVEELGSSEDDYVIDETAENDVESQSSDDETTIEDKGEKKGKVEHKKKKINIREKAKLMIKEVALKREKKDNEIREYLKERAKTDDSFDHLFAELKYCKVSRDDKNYNKARLFLDVFVDGRKKAQGVNNWDETESKDAQGPTIEELGPVSKKRKVR